MKKTNCLLIFILCLILSLSVFAACSGNGGDPSGSNSNNPSAVKPNEPDKEDSADLPYQKKEVTVTVHYDDGRSSASATVLTRQNLMETDAASFFTEEYDYFIGEHQLSPHLEGIDLGIREKETTTPLRAFLSDNTEIQAYLKNSTSDKIHVIYDQESPLYLDLNVTPGSTVKSLLSNPVLKDISFDGLLICSEDVSEVDENHIVRPDEEFYIRAKDGAQLTELVSVSLCFGDIPYKKTFFGLPGATLAEIVSPYLNISFYDFYKEGRRLVEPSSKIDQSLSLYAEYLGDIYHLDTLLTVVNEFTGTTKTYANEIKSLHHLAYSYSYPHNCILTDENGAPISDEYTPNRDTTIHILKGSRDEYAKFIPVNIILPNEQPIECLVHDRDSVYQILRSNTSLLVSEMNGYVWTDEYNRAIDLHDRLKSSTTIRAYPPIDENGNELYPKKGVTVEFIKSEILPDKVCFYEGQSSVSIQTVLDDCGVTEETLVKYEVMVWNSTSDGGSSLITVTDFTQTIGDGDSVTLQLKEEFRPVDPTPTPGQVHLSFVYQGYELLSGNVDEGMDFKNAFYQIIEQQGEETKQLFEGCIFYYFNEEGDKSPAENNFLLQDTVIHVESKKNSLCMIAVNMPDGSVLNLLFNTTEQLFWHDVFLREELIQIAEKASDYTIIIDGEKYLLSDFLDFSSYEHKIDTSIFKAGEITLEKTNTAIELLIKIQQRDESYATYEKTVTEGYLDLGSLAKEYLNNSNYYDVSFVSDDGNDDFEMPLLDAMSQYPILYQGGEFTFSYNQNAVVTLTLHVLDKGATAYDKEIKESAYEYVELQDVLEKYGYDNYGEYAAYHKTRYNDGTTNPDRYDVTFTDIVLPSGEIIKENNGYEYTFYSSREIYVVHLATAKVPEFKTVYTFHLEFLTSDGKHSELLNELHCEISYTTKTASFITAVGQTKLKMKQTEFSLADILSRSKLYALDGLEIEEETRISANSLAKDYHLVAVLVTDEIYEKILKASGKDEDYIH